MDYKMQMESRRSFCRIIQGDDKSDIAKIKCPDISVELSKTTIKDKIAKIYKVKHLSGALVALFIYTGTAQAKEWTSCSFLSNDRPILLTDKDKPFSDYGQNKPVSTHNKVELALVNDGQKIVTNLTESLKNELGEQFLETVRMSDSGNLTIDFTDGKDKLGKITLDRNPNTATSGKFASKDLDFIGNIYGTISENIFDNTADKNNVRLTRIKAQCSIHNLDSYSLEQIQLIISQLPEIKFDFTLLWHIN